MDPLALAVAVTGLSVLAIAVAFHEGSVRELLEDRFVYGVPWGSLLTIGLVLVVYLLVQSGLWAFRSPVEIPFRAWSYFYPLGIAASAFTHASDGHLIGNLLGAAAVAPIAEYAWGHYPESPSEAWWDRPAVRALVAVPGAALVVGLLTGVFGLGPVIGFSSVIYAMAAFAMVRYPITTLLATVTVQSALMTVYRALETPILVHVPSASGPSTPGWATIAIQGHAIGFAIGLAIGLAVFTRRGTRPDPFRFWVALVLFGFAKSLWAIYWFGDGSYLLFRAPGVIAVLVLSVVLTLAVARPVGRPSAGRLEAAVSRLHRRTAANGLVVVIMLVALLAGPAIPANLFVVDDQSVPGDEVIEIEDYTVTYAEGVENELVSVVDLSDLGIDTSIEASGVIVSSPKRHVWLEAVTTRQLAASGERTIVLGGVGWRETVTARWDGWTPVGNSSAHQVWLEAGDEAVMAHASEPVRADVVVANATITIDPADSEFVAVVTHEDKRTSVSLPGDGESTAVGPLELERVDDTLYALHDTTRVPVAERTH